MCLPVTLPIALAAWPGAAIQPMAWGAFAYVAVFSMWLGFFAWYAGLQRGGIGSSLLHAFLDQLKRRCVAGVHVSTMSEQGKAFFGKAGMQRLARYPGSKLPGHTASEVWFMGMKPGS